MVRDRENDSAGALEFLAQHSEDAIAQGWVGYKVGVEAGDGEVGLGHGDFHAANETREQRKAVQHFAQEFDVRCSAPREAFDGVADPEPRWYGMAALHPAKDPGDGGQVFETSILVAAGGAGGEGRVVQFVHGGCLVEGFEDFKIFWKMFSG